MEDADLDTKALETKKLLKEIDNLHWRTLLHMAQIFGIAVAFIVGVVTVWEILRGPIVSAIGG